MAAETELQDPNGTDLFSPQTDDIFIPPIPRHVNRFISRVWRAFVTKTVSLKFSDNEYCFDYAAFEVIDKDALRIVASVSQAQLKEFAESDEKQKAREIEKDNEPVSLSNKDYQSIRLIRQAINDMGIGNKPEVGFYSIAEMGDKIPLPIRSILAENMNYAAGIVLFVKDQPIGVLWGIRKTILEQTQLKELVWQFHSLFDGIDNICGQELDRGGDASFTRMIIEKLDTTSQIYRIFYTKVPRQEVPLKSTVAHSYVFDKSYRLDASYIIPTSDGFKVTLKQYLPEEHNNEKITLLMIPGFFCNRSLMDRMAMEMSLTHGYKVLSADMRGRSKFTLPAKGIGNGWSVDDYIWKDLPATLRWIRHFYPDDKIVIVGHSMGGMIPKFYAACYKKMAATGVYPDLIDPEKILGGICTITSPSYIDLETGVQAVDFLVKIGRALGSNPVSQTLLGALSYGLLPPFATIDLNRLFSLLRSLSSTTRNMSFNVSNIPTLKDFIGYEQITAPEWYFFTENVFCEEGVKVIIQFLKSWINKNSSFMSYDGKFNYTEEQSQLQLPIFSIIGTKDKIAPPETIEYGLTFIDSANVRKAHYAQGHMGIVFHPETVREIGVELRDWIHSFR